MAIRKRGDGRWQVRVRPFPEVTVPTKLAAETIELEHKLRLKLGRLYQEKPVTLGVELAAFLDRKESMGGRRGKLRPATIEDLRKSAKVWKPLERTVIPAIRRVVVEDLISARAKVAPVAAAHELQLLKTCLRAAASRGQAVDPGIFEIGAIYHEAAEGVALEIPQLEEIASTMPDRIKRVVVFTGLVGLRFTEAMTLTDDRVDLANGSILIPRDLNKGRRAKPIPLARVETQILREQLMARPAGTRLVFPTERLAVYSKSGFRSVWLPALEAAGFSREDDDGRTVHTFRFHWLRHTAISLMARAGLKPELIAERVGHKDGGSLIYRRYRHLFPDEMRAAVGLLDDLYATVSDTVSDARKGALSGL